MLTSMKSIDHVYSVPPSGRCLNRWRATILNGQVNETLRYSDSDGGNHVTASLVARIGTTPCRPRIVNRVPTPIGLESACHTFTAGSISGPVSGELTTANTSTGG